MSADARRAFVDSNILIYAHDAAGGAKYERARELLDTLWNDSSGCLSIQVLQEFFVNVTRKLGVDTASARGAVADFARWTMHEPAAEDILAAIELHEQARIAFWDAMIVRSAAVLGCDALYTEDMNPGQSYDGVLVVNPFV